MGKKTWLKVKRGLVRDPKHREAIGEAIWVYLYMLDLADWPTGKIDEWRDSDAAEEMDMPQPTVRYHRMKLERAGYITARQGRHLQEITIHNWNDPRSYDGVVYNPKEKNSPKSEPQQQPARAAKVAFDDDGTLSPSKFNGDNYGDNYGDNPPSPSSLYIPHDHIITHVPAEPEPEAAAPRVCDEKRKPEERRVECPGCKGMVPVRNTNVGEAAICMTCKWDVLTVAKIPDEGSIESDTGKCVEFYKHRFREIHKREPHVSKGKDWTIVKGLVKEHGKEAVQEFMRGFLAIDDAELQKAGWPLSWLPNRINSIIVKQSGAKPPPANQYPVNKELEARLRADFAKRQERSH